MWWGGPFGRAGYYMKDLKAARELAERAKIDLAALREIAGNPRVADEIFGFLAQQAVEKSMKAWLALLGRRYPVTHNLHQLARELKDAGVSVAGYGDLSSLSPFAVQFRYETMDSSEPGLDRKGILRMVGALVEKIRLMVETDSEKGPEAREPRATYRVARIKKGRRKMK
jgi:HEPN domain-containing protein